MNFVLPRCCLQVSLITMSMCACGSLPGSCRILKSQNISKTYKKSLWCYDKLFHILAFPCQQAVCRGAAEVCPLTKLRAGHAVHGTLIQKGPKGKFRLFFVIFWARDRSQRLLQALSFNFPSKMPDLDAYCLFAELCHSWHPHPFFHIVLTFFWNVWSWRSLFGRWRGQILRKGGHESVGC